MSLRLSNYNALWEYCGIIPRPFISNAVSLSTTKYMKTDHLFWRHAYS